MVAERTSQGPRLISLETHSARGDTCGTFFSRLASRSALTRARPRVWTPATRSSRYERVSSTYKSCVCALFIFRREYGVECTVGQPQVNYRETITKKIPFNYLHKKQTGGSGQYARVMGYIEPLPADTRDKNNELVHFRFENRVLGTAIPPEFIASVEKGKHRLGRKMASPEGFCWHRRIRMLPRLSIDYPYPTTLSCCIRRVDPTLIDM